MTRHTISADALHDEPPSADEDVATLRLLLSHKPVEELVEDELVEWDKENNLVRKGPTFDQERPLKR